jgi:hypothetical protein
MLLARITGLLWIVLCTLAFAVNAPEFVSLLFSSETGTGTGFYSTDFWVAQFSLYLCLLCGIFLGWGLFRLRVWAAICAIVWAVVLLLCAFSFILMVWSGFRVIPYRLSWFEVLFAAFTLSVVGFMLTSRANKAVS